VGCFQDEPVLPHVLHSRLACFDSIGTAIAKLAIQQIKVRHFMFMMMVFWAIWDLNTGWDAFSGWMKQLIKMQNNGDVVQLD
jgi:hypothetical protein